MKAIASKKRVTDKAIDIYLLYSFTHYLYIPYTILPKLNFNGTKFSTYKHENFQEKKKLFRYKRKAPISI